MISQCANKPNAAQFPKHIVNSGAGTLRGVQSVRGELRTTIDHVKPPSRKSANDTLTPLPGATLQRHPCAARTVQSTGGAHKIMESPNMHVEVPNN